MQLSSPSSGNSQNVTQTATTVAQGVSHNQQQNIVMVRYLLDQIKNNVLKCQYSNFIIHT